MAAAHAANCSGVTACRSKCHVGEAIAAEMCREAVIDARTVGLQVERVGHAVHASRSSLPSRGTKNTLNTLAEVI